MNIHNTIRINKYLSNSTYVTIIKITLKFVFFQPIFSLFIESSKMRIELYRGTKFYSDFFLYKTSQKLQL